MPEPANTPAHHQPKIPAAIRKQAERAEQLQRESVGTPEPPAEGTEAPPAAEAPAQPPAAETPPAAPAAPPSPPPAPSIDQQLATTQGRLDAEREKNQQQAGEIASLRRMVEQLQGHLRQPPAAAPSDLPKPPKGKLVTPEEEADYGEELLKVMGKRARDEVAGEIDSLKQEIGELKGVLGSVGSRVEARDTNEVFNQLARVVPNWAMQNADANFIGWLQQPEPFSGIKRHELLMKAFNSHDADRVIMFFQGYLAEAAATGQGPAPTPPSPPPAANGKVPLSTFAAPGRAAPAPSSAPPGTKPTYTRAQISQFFTEKSAGRWRGRESEAAALEADIFRAGPEGRVIG